jgi:hypothetical protein
MANVRKMLGTMVIDVLLSFNYAVGDRGCKQTKKYLKRQSAANS